MVTRPKLIAGLAVLTLAGASSSVALGNGSYGVKFDRVPTNAVDGQAASFVVSARTPVTPRKTVDLVVFTSSTHACAAAADAEWKLRRDGKARVAISAKYHGDFIKRDSFFPAKGTYHLCAYVYAVETQTLAHAAASFQVK
ncbi:MAG: hypothetical protein ACTHQQ_12570 [Solirubrobacteraceae bacterium]